MEGALRASKPEHAKIPVVILTGHDDPQFKDAAKRRGVAAYVTKPFRDWELIDAVKRVVSGRLRRDPWAQ
jgi:FixJ family two-component response regulator